MERKSPEPLINNNIMNDVLKAISAIMLTACIYACENSKSPQKHEYNIKISNVNLNITTDTIQEFLGTDVLRTVVQFDNKFYGVIESEKNENNEKKMVIFSDSKKRLNRIDLPENIQKEIIYHLNVQEDSLFLTGEGYKETYYLDKNGVFNSVPYKKFKFYGDGLYYIYSDCNGEWGGSVNFKSKKTNEVYKADIACPIVVNKIADEYYFTTKDDEQGSFALYKVANPMQLNVATQSVELLHEASGMFFSTSFVLDNQLIHLYSDENATYLGVFENNKLTPKYKFPLLFHAKLNQHSEYKKQVLNCYFPKTKKSGIISIENTSINFHILN